MRINNIRRLVAALVVALLAPAASFAADPTLSIESFTIKAGETKEMLIDLTNPGTEITLVQFDLRLPSGLTIAEEEDEMLIDIAGRTTYKKHSLDANAIDGITRFLLSSTKNSVISGESGAIISIMLTASASFNGGDIMLEGQRLVMPDAVATTYKPATYTYHIEGTQSDAVTIKAKSYSRVYGEANPTFGYEVTEGTITSGTPTVTCSATKTSPVGTYDIVITKGTVSNGTVNLVKGTLTITKAPLTISAGNYTKQEGEANPTFTPTFSGFKNSETKSVLTTQPTITTTATTSSPAGTYPVTVSGAAAQNYSFTYVNGTLTVTAKPDNVTIKAKSYSRVYGEANPTFGYEVTEGTITSGTPTITCSATKTSPVGTYDIVISKGTVSNGTVNLVKGTLTITKAPLTISAGNYTKQEGEANPTFTPTFSGFKNSETKAVLTTQPTITTTATTSSPAGTYPVTVSGAAAQNYSFTYVNGTLTVTAKPIVKDNIQFADAKVKAICVQNWDTDSDGELSKDEAAAVTDLGLAFDYNTQITTFDEFQYFTGMTYADFSGCTKLRSLVLPESITFLPQAAFLGTALQKIHIPRKVAEIGDVVFSSCNSLTSITVDSNNPYFDSRNGCNGIIETAKNKLIAGCKTTVIPESVTSIGPSAIFYLSTATSIHIPASVTKLDEEPPFMYCTGLTSVTVAPGNPVYDSRDNCNAIIKTATNTLIAGCNTTKIPKTVKTIGPKAFQGSGITSIRIPSPVETLNYQAFMMCKSLTDVTIPHTLKAIKHHAFFECNNLKTVTSYIQTPFELEDSAFPSIANESQKPVLHVPAGKKAAYEAAGWDTYFKSIIEDVSTDIDEVNENENENESKVIYNLAGQRLTKPQRGVNIVGGRKVVVRR